MDGVPSLEGWMVKQNPRAIGGMVTWKRRYFRVEGQRLSYFKDHKSGGKCLGFIPLSTITAVQKAMFPKVPEKRYVNCGLTLATVGGRAYNLLTDNTEDRELWLRVLPQIIAFWRNGPEQGVQEQEQEEVAADDSIEDSIESRYHLEDSSDDEGDESPTLKAAPSVAFANGGHGGFGGASSPPRFANGGLSSAPGSAGSLESVPEGSVDDGGDAWGASGLPARTPTRSDSITSNIVSNYTVGEEDMPPDEDTGGSGYRRRSAALPSVSEDARKSARSLRTGSGDESRLSPSATTTGEAAGLGSMGAIKVWLDDGQFKSYVLPNGATAEALRTKITSSLPPELASEVQLWHMTTAGVPRLLQPEQDPFALKRQRSQVYLLSPERRLAAVFFEDGSFVPAVFNANVAADQICNGHVNSPALAEKALDIGDPGLFVRRPGHRDQLFHPEDNPLDVLYEAADAGSDRAAKPDIGEIKLVLKSRSLRPQSTSSQLTGPAPTFHSDTGMVAQPQSTDDGGLRSFLFKKGVRNSAWKKRWCTFQSGVVRYYKSLSDREPAGSFQAAEIDVVEEMPEAQDRGHAFCFRVATSNGRDYLFCAETQSLMLQWISQLQAIVTHADKCGWLLKKGFKHRAWKRRWCVLRGTDLLYFENQDDRVKRGAVDLDAATEIVHNEDTDHENEFRIDCGERTYRFRASTLQEMNEWIRACRGLESTRPVAEPVVQVAGHSFEKRAPGNEFGSDFDGPVDTPNFASPSAAAFEQSQPPSFANGSPMTYRNEFQVGDDPFAVPSRSRSSTVPSSRPKPEPLPAPEIAPDESASTAFYTEEQWESHKNKKATKLSDALESALVDDNVTTSLSGDLLSSSLAGNPKDREREDVDRLKEKAALSSTPNGTPRRQLTDDVRKRLGLTDPKLDAQVPNPEMATGTSKATEVPTPAVLKIVLLQHGRSGGAAQPKMARISLSGVILQNSAGQWRKDDVCLWSGKPPQEGCEVFNLPPNIVASYHAGNKRWYVRPAETNAAGSANGSAAAGRAERSAAAPGGSANGPRGSAPGANGVPNGTGKPPTTKAWIQLGGMQFVSAVHSAVEAVLGYYAEAGVGMEPEDRLTLLDDSLHADVGVLVRSRLCSAFAEVFAHGLLPTRLGGLVKNSIWSVVVGACGRPTSKTSAAGIAAHRVVQDLATNPNMDGDDNIKFRTFICASLNHRFLEEWLGDLFRNQRLLSKYYSPGAFLLTCPAHIFDELLLGLQPLMVLPFRLHSSFEITRKMSLMRRLSTRGATTVTTPRARTATVPASHKVRHQKLPIVRALYANEANDEDELSFGKGDVLEVEMRVSDDWLMCILNGERGLVPQNYVQAVDIGDTDC
eukprot:m.484823 g.484823  ORF g.484823 m.484823 type:complete len:1355 (-) comp23557_c0_seq1:62-4126(-)